LADLCSALLSHCTRPNVSVNNAWTLGNWEFFLHPRLSTAATNELHLLQHSLQDIHPVHGLLDRRGIGQDLTPFSSARFYTWNMMKRPLDAFAAAIWCSAAIPR
ncbi:hypothetical protein BAE44_0013781, partial [Dichanthelium oligosanthes]